MRQNAFLLAAIMALTLAAASCGDAAGNNLPRRTILRLT